MGSFLGQKWAIFDPFLTPFWAIFGPFLGPFWDPFWAHFRRKEGDFGVKNGAQNGVIFGPIFDPFLGPKMGYFGPSQALGPLGRS